MDDLQLLRQYIKDGSQDAFAGIVDRHVDLVYGTARRLVGDEHLAQDVAQAVFVVLARRAKQVEPGRLAGWLVNAARLAANEARRSRLCREKHEWRAAQMRSSKRSEDGDEPTLEQLTPLLDEALCRLGEADRTAVAMRFLEGRSFAEVAAAMGLSEEAARKRVERAVEKLRGMFMKKGFAPSVGGLMVVLAAHQAQAAPAGLAGSISATAISGGVGTSAILAKGAMKIMVWAKVKVAAVILALATATVVAAAAGVAALNEKKQVAASSGAAGVAPTASPAQQSIPTTGPNGPKAAFMEIAASARRLDAKGVADGFDAQTADEREFVAAYAEGLVSMERFRQAMEKRFGSDERYSLMGAGNSIAMLPLEQATEHITGESASLEVVNRGGISIAVPMKLIGGRWRLPVKQMWDVIQKAAAANGAQIPPMKVISEASRKTAPAFQHVAELVNNGTYASKADALTNLETEMAKARKD